MYTGHSRRTAAKTLIMAGTSSLLFVLGSTQALAQKEFGKGKPFEINDLPPGILKNQLGTLNADARERALTWLHRFSFTEADLPSLRVDDGGGIYYVDQFEPHTPADNLLEDPAYTSVSESELFSLNSKPGASRTLYLDFDGAVIQETAWNSTHSRLDAAPYDRDGNHNSFTNSEIAEMYEIWNVVADHFSPWDVNVTTIEPSSFGPNTGHALVTQSTDINGKAMPSQGAGGVAYVGVWGRTGTYDFQYYSPSFTYNKGMQPAAVTVSHEVGHNLNLSHDGRISPSENYYDGHGSGNTSWGPIMGSPFYQRVTQWSNGNYTSANQTQNDTSIIEGYLTLRSDDHSDNTSGATPLTVEADGSIMVSSQITDPGNLYPDNKGVIETSGDWDFFQFQAGAGPATLRATPSWDASNSSYRGGSLDIELVLYDSGGSPLTSADALDNTNAVISTNLSGGTYYLGVQGVGDDSTPYNDYGSLGLYFLSGAVTPYSETPPNAPSGLVATANGANQVDLAWQDHADNESLFRIQRSDNDGSWADVDTVGANIKNYADTTVSPSSSYEYQVRAENGAGDSNWQQSNQVITDDPPAFVDYTPTSQTATAGQVSGGLSNLENQDGSYQQITEVQSGGKKSNRYTYLEHRWAVTIPGGGSLVEVLVDATSNGTQMHIEYFDGSWTKKLDVDSDGSLGSYRTFDLPADTSGTVNLRVIDTNQDAGAQDYDWVRVDHLFVRVHNGGTIEAPNAASGLEEIEVSSTSASMSWSDNSSDESGFRVERDSGGGWETAGSTGADQTSFTDTGLAPESSHVYRVVAFNAGGVASPSNEITITTVPSSGPVITEINSYKERGVRKVYLSWNGGDGEVRVYRDDNVVHTTSATSHTDTIAGKGGGSFDYKVCLVSDPDSCSDTETVVF